MTGGNTTVLLQVKSSNTKNGIGERIPSWHNVCELTGFLDLQSGDSRNTSYMAEIQESTHIFICDYMPIPETLEIEGKIIKVKAENTRIVENSQNYDVKLIDDPMNLHKHLEIHLKYTGGQ